MRIIEITGEPIQYGGQEKFISNVLENMDRTGLQIDVLTPYYCDNSAFRDLIDAIGGKLYEFNLPFLPGKSRRLLLKPMTSFLKESRYDAVHIHSGSISVLAYCALAAKKAGVKRILVHSHSTGIPSVKHTIIKTVFGFVIKTCATDFLACSMDAGRTKYPKEIVENKLLILKNGIPISAYRRDEIKRSEIRKQLGIPDDRFVLGHVGRFSAEKNHHFLVEVFSQIHKELPDSKLLLVGDGELAADIEKQVESKDLRGVVIFTGNVDNVQDYYQAMDCFLLPSLYEGFPFVTVEAQAAGLPCVISTGVPTDVMISSNIFRLDLSDPQAWVKTILSLRDTPPADNTEKIKAAGYDIEDTAAYLRGLYLSR